MAFVDFTDDTDSDSTSKTPTLVLDQALSHLATAIAALHRAGPVYSHHTQPFWHFAAGTWSPFQYRCKVIEASKKLPTKTSTHEDLAMAIEELQKATTLLAGEGDWRDARDLEEALGTFLMNIEQGL